MDMSLFGNGQEFMAPGIPIALAGPVVLRRRTIDPLEGLDHSAGDVGDSSQWLAQAGPTAGGQKKHNTRLLPQTRELKQRKHVFGIGAGIRPQHVHFSQWATKVTTWSLLMRHEGDIKWPKAEAFGSSLLDWIGQHTSELLVCHKNQLPRPPPPPKKKEDVQTGRSFPLVFLQANLQIGQPAKTRSGRLSSFSWLARRTACEQAVRVAAHEPFVHLDGAGADGGRAKGKEKTGCPRYTPLPRNRLWLWVFGVWVVMLPGFCGLGRLCGSRVAPVWDCVKGKAKKTPPPFYPTRWARRDPSRENEEGARGHCG